MELKWFRPTTYTQGLGHVLGMIYKELVALQPVDSTDVTWRRTSTGIQAYVKPKPASSTGSASSLPQTETPKAAAAGEKYQFTITTEIREVENEDGTKSNVPFVVVVDANDPKSGTSGKCRFGNGDLFYVSSYTLSKTPGTRYVFLVMDVTKTPAVYVLENSTSYVKGVNGSVIQIGYYTWDESTKTLKATQLLKQNTPVDIGPTYIGPWCTLPAQPAVSSDGVAYKYAYLINPKGSITVSSGEYTVNGQIGGVASSSAVFFSNDSGYFPAYVGWKAPQYAPRPGWSGSYIQIESSSLVISSSYDDLQNSYDAVMPITGNASGVIDVKWISTTVDTIQSVLFDASFIES